jgi:hypothetical protein
MAPKSAPSAPEPAPDRPEVDELFSGRLPIQEALAKLRVRLLDLTTRNRLLNFKHAPGKTLQFVNSAPDAVFTKLMTNSGAKVAVNPVPEPKRADWVRVNGRLTRPDVKQYACEHGLQTDYELMPVPTLEGGAVRALYYPDDLAKHCRKLAREARSAIEETGANMLFLVFGFLEFPDQNDSDRILTAPLVCVPVSLDKDRIDPVTGQDCFVLKYTGEDLSENLSLREKLVQLHSFELPAFDEETGPEGYFDEIAQTLTTKPRWTVKRQMTLALLSFSKMLLVRDIDPKRWPSGENGESSLLDHKIVRMVFEGAKVEDGSATSPIGEDYEVDNQAGPELPLIYDADSSQHSALIDTLGGKNLVVEGPPGTGKSQTITNLIAAALAEGKSVLFVAEKLAALQVVKKRLAHANLGDFCLELHSNKTQKKLVMEELQKRRDAKFTAPLGLKTKLELLESARVRLKRYADLMNSVRGNACELSVHQILWRAERLRQETGEDWNALRDVYIQDAEQFKLAQFRSQSSMLEQLVSQFEQIGSYGPKHPFWGLYVEELLPGADSKIADVLQEFLPAFEDVVATFGHIFTFLGGQGMPTSASDISVLQEVLVSATPPPPSQMAHDALPRFFPEHDAEGHQAKAVLEAFAKTLAHVAKLRADIGTRLITTEQLTEIDRLEATKLLTALTSAGIQAKSARELQELANRLAKLLDAASHALARLQALGAAAGQAFTGDFASLQKLIAIGQSAAAAPRDLLGYRYPELDKADTVNVLRRARTEHRAFTQEASELQVLFYLDSLQSDQGKAQVTWAIEVLREGDSWYRIFQGRWRKACAVHRKLDRNKRNLNGTQRLRELERISTMLTNGRRWYESAEYRAVLGPFLRSGEPDFANALRLAQWYRETHVRLVNAQIEVRTVLGADEARIAKLAGIQAEVVIADGALASLRQFLQEQIGSSQAGQKLDSFTDWLQLVDWAKDLRQAVQSAVDRLNVWAAPATPAIETVHAVQAQVALPVALGKLQADTKARELLGEHYQGADTQMGSVLAALAYGQQLFKLFLPPAIRHALLSADVAQNHRILVQAAGKILQGWHQAAQFAQRMGAFGRFEISEWANQSPSSSGFMAALALRTKTALESIDRLLPWMQYIQVAKHAREQGAHHFLVALEQETVESGNLVSGYGYRFFSSIARTLFNKEPELAQFAGASHEKTRATFAQLDREIIKLRGFECARKAASGHTPPIGNRSTVVGEKTEMELINHMISKPLARVTLRRMLERSSKAVQALKPCFMMGPQAVAQYLKPGSISFDLVVMDEASQLRPEDALGAIARGKQLIVVGDPKQLPPTSFFDRLGGATDDMPEGMQSVTDDAESILDVCMGHFRPVRTLRWHYRSRHESLIAFSNSHFYNSRLIVFPSPYGKSDRLGLRYHYVPNAVYESQTNQAEAKRVVDAAIEHMQHHKDESLGIVTLNLRQRDLIEEMLEARCRHFPDTEVFRANWEKEGYGFFVKNLESVQGDERDVMFISTTFGPAPNTRVVRQNFGPISRQTGWRRLNVLFTRARNSVHVFSSMRPEDIVVDAGTPVGTRALREYLEFARSGVLATVGPTDGEADSDFEAAVTEVLKSAGYEVVPQLGVAGFRIDIAVKHPQYPAAYLAAIECDGASYHTGVSVRDRDRIRQEILESLGWAGRIWRIWSTDWFRSPKSETSKMLAFLESLKSKPLPESYVEEVPEAAEEPVEEAVKEPIEQPLAETAISGSAPGPRVSYQSALFPEEKPVVPDVDEDEDLEVEVGDTVTYAPAGSPHEPITVQIVLGKGFTGDGLIAESTPLAQVLLGAVVNDQVVLRVPGKAPQPFVVKKIVRAGRH